MAKSDSTKEAEARRRCQRECKARCCRYLTIQIPAPKLKSDFDELSWFLAHENISVYVESRRWHVEVKNRCKHLTRDNLCDDYENRPEVCRIYGGDGACEYPDRPVHHLNFDCQEEFDAWLERRRKRERRRRRARAARRRTSQEAKG